jgi:hypothetical protein
MDPSTFVPFGEKRAFDDHYDRKLGTSKSVASLGSNIGGVRSSISERQDLRGGYQNKGDTYNPITNPIPWIN